MSPSCGEAEASLTLLGHAEMHVCDDNHRVITLITVVLNVSGGVRHLHGSHGVYGETQAGGRQSSKHCIEATAFTEDG